MSQWSKWAIDRAAMGEREPRAEVDLRLMMKAEIQAFRANHPAGKSTRCTIQLPTAPPAFSRHPPKRSCVSLVVTQPPV